jgi:hypothetical protein
MSPYGMSGIPGTGGFATPWASPSPMSPITGAMPGLGSGGPWQGIPWANGVPGGSQGIPWSGQWGGQQSQPVAGLLDGIWELNRGGLIVIRADTARLYLSRDQYQDYLVRYDDTHFWWRPRDGSKFERYRYEMREGRMVLADDDGNLLLLRRRR